ncbi:MAG: ABC transporter permease subunit [Phototrophicaceae bacterium]
MAEDNTANSSVATLDSPQSSGSRGYWADAWGRLTDNRLATLGLIIIIINLLMAIFAPLVAVEGIDDQNTEEANAAPGWVINLFPILTPRDESFPIDDGAIVVETGQIVSEGDLLIDFTQANLTTSVDGTVFVDARRIYVVPNTIEIERIAVPSGVNQSSIPIGGDVAAGDILFRDVTSPIAGAIYFANNEIIIRPQTVWRRGDGEELVANLQEVAIGDVLFTTEDGTEVVAPYAGTIFITRNNIELALVPPLEFDVPDGAEIQVRDGRSVETGAILFDDVTAPIGGDVFVQDNTIFIRQPEQWLRSSGNVSVVSGQTVAAGDLLIDFTTRNVYANMDGTIFINDDDVLLTPVTPQRLDLPADAEIAVTDGQIVTEGTLLFNNESADIGGIVYILDDALFVRGISEGYVPLRNEYRLGADYLGRDLWSRIAYGARVSLLAAFIGPLVSFAVGMPYGLISGYFGGAVDNWMMRFVDLMYAFPTLLLIILLMAFFRSSASLTQPGTFIYQMGEIDRATGGVFFIFLGIGLTSWMQLARLTRGQVLSARESDYVLAARALGQSTPGIMIRHILPNVLGPIVISETLSIPTYIRFEAFLSFIGLGVNAPTPSWGGMISDGASVLRNYPHEALFPALALFLIMFAFNFLGDGLRDALDPRLRGTN